MSLEAMHLFWQASYLTPLARLVGIRIGDCLQEREGAVDRDGLLDWCNIDPPLLTDALDELSAARLLDYGVGGDSAGRTVVAVRIYGMPERGPPEPSGTKSQEWAKRRAKALARSYGLCWYCGEGEANAPHEIDHQDPRSRGGTGRAHNLVAACSPCNRSKSARTVEEFRHRLAERSGLPLEAIAFFGEVIG